MFTPDLTRFFFQCMQCAVRSGTETRETFENACTAKCAKATVVKLSACDDANGQTCSFCPKDAGGEPHIALHLTFNCACAATSNPHM